MPRLALSDFCGGSATERSIGISSDRTVNLYPIVIAPDVRPPTLALVSTPGLQRFCALPGGPIRLLHTATNGRVFAVAGATFYEVFAGGTALTRGSVTPGTGRVSLDDNGIAAMVVDGPAGWVFTFATNTYAQITDADFTGADFVTYVDGYFAFNVPGTGRFGITGLFDPTNVDALDIATAEARPDPLLRVTNLHRELRLWGTLTVEAWFNSGNPDFPFQQIQGSVLEQGLGAPDSLVVLNNAYLWLHANRQGLGQVLTSTAYTAQAVSTPAQEQHWLRYPRRDDAIAFGYTEGGHDFYVLTFPSGNATWVLDLSTGFWHERAFLDPSGGFSRHLAQYHCVAFGTHLVGDYRTGLLYTLSEQAYTDDGREIVRLRRFPHVRAERQRLFQSTLEVHVEQGETVSDPVEPRHLQLRWSNDGGHTYSDEHWRELGPVGAYRQRARWHKLGQARDRVYELRSTAAGPTRWLAAYLDGEGGAH